MRYCSTRNAALERTASQAILQGIAEDGGLFVPESFPRVELSALAGLSYSELAARILGLYLTDYSTEFLRRATAEVYGPGRFENRPARTVRLDDGLYSLELWHGPTCAFKDYALQLMPRLLVEAKRINGDTSKTVILVATSGDTGKAALEGYRDLPGIEIAVFYPDHGTSEIQRLQMATQEGSNVHVYAVRGNFDDAQTGVKRVFTDAAFAAECAAQGKHLTSANSINWGRLVPQIVYYFASYLQLAAAGELHLGDAVDFCVPTGNFGDILAGYYAKQMGLPVGRLICASNRNHVLSDFGATGRYDANRPFYKTTSPSMDILVSSNLERLLYHKSGDAAAVASRMAALAEHKDYSVTPALLARIGEDFSFGWADEEECAAAISLSYIMSNYLADPHTAAALKVADDLRRTEAPCVVLSTASPYKFAGAVLAALGQDAGSDDFANIAALESYTNAPAPASLKNLAGKQPRFDRVIAAEEIAAVARAL